ncbi:hypothetical protein DOTSEDRAFT_49249 [Dothistroma septosporum NZE10]|uniref:FAM192A/Fyv6 N-terminal domain-containing protein n=1 Tax=Dothistroma septosporum (strain NZE10 / CBS 128990) TaxID=675120 RepID=N1PZJ4_DOTSN|nr:hypothetical protein DOTSEDRAFT_49249 [Dothistroma septosporum NZE10]
MSRFVSGGTNEEPTARDEAWLQAQTQIEAKHLAKIEAGKQEGGKSLYETLQANKAAKQEQFEESIRLTNQFQSLNEDEVEFLDSVLETQRQKENNVRKQTAEEMQAFKQQQEDAEKKARAAETTHTAETENTSWAVSRKRKKGKEDVFGGVKLRKASSGEGSLAAPSTEWAKRQARADAVASTEDTSIAAQRDEADRAKGNIATNAGLGKEKTSVPKPIVALNSAGLGLAAYASDEDD